MNPESESDLSNHFGSGSDPKNSVADRHRFDADPDPDPTFSYDADPDPDPDSDPDPDPTLKVSQVYN